MRSCTPDSPRSCRGCSPPECVIRAFPSATRSLDPRRFARTDHRKCSSPALHVVGAGGDSHRDRLHDNGGDSAHPARDAGTVAARSGLGGCPQARTRAYRCLFVGALSPQRTTTVCRAEEASGRVSPSHRAGLGCAGLDWTGLGEAAKVTPHPGHRNRAETLRRRFGSPAACTRRSARRGAVQAGEAGR